ncbi:OpgC domain-containing protein [Microbacterium sp. LWH3-1.2]|uniref:OpgC domain-containing protein n=1 Tax=Microbacterium sp. LWH3-1.2 TaxID=3135256 RepID=UPI00342CAEA1
MAARRLTDVLSRAALGRILAGAAAIVLLSTALAASPAAAVAPTPPVVPAEQAPLSPSSGAYFGVTLDWSIDNAGLEADRLGLTPAAYEHTTTLPITDDEERYLGEFFRQSHAEGSIPIVTLQPAGGLADFDREAAQEAVDSLAASGKGDQPFYVRFAPDMNASWVPWGQEPAAYVAAFRLFADTLHASLPDAALVWSPLAGESYPFADPRAVHEAGLDTNADGRLGFGDDPYGPYYPGRSYVDWVGLAAYHDASGGGPPVNAIPAEGTLLSDLSGRGALDFYGRFAAATRTPMLLETAALYSPGSGGATALAIKRAWWQQSIDALTSGDYPLIDVALWRDSSSRRVAVGEVVIDWSISSDPAVAAAFRADVERGPLVFGPVYTPSGVRTATANGLTISGAPAWAVVVIVLAATAFLLVWGLRRGRVGSLAYIGPPNRDLRIDLLRGVAIVFVVVNHLALTSLLQNATQEAIGVVSGAELFVLLSGAVLGMVYRPKLVAGGVGEVTVRTTQRAWKLYVTALVVVMIIGALSLLPFLNTTPVTTFTDQGTGAAGSEATGRIYELYANFETLLRYPVDPSIVVDIALLRLGPWQVNVLGLYVVMLALSPLILWALSRRNWALVLAVSWAVYVIERFLSIRVLPSQFEDSFPLLTWQVLFVTGTVAGFHRREILVWFQTRIGSIALGLCVLATVALAVFSWNNPYLSSAYDMRLGLVPSNAYASIYSSLFERTTLEPGRLLNVFLVTITAYALLSVLWKPVNRLFGWFFLPLGQATLYVFIMHVFFVLLVANVPVLHEGNVLIDTLAYLVVLALLWVMVKTRFLFVVVPR